MDETRNIGKKMKAIFTAMITMKIFPANLILKNRSNFFEPKNSGAESAISERLKKWKSIKSKILGKISNKINP